MRRRWLLAGVLALISGCGQAEPTGPGAATATAEPSQAAPKPGDRLLMPNLGFPFQDLDSLRTARRWRGMNETQIHAQPAEALEQWKANNRKSAGMISPGDLVQILEVGPDYVAVDVVKDHRGEPGPHGYLDPWWMPPPS